MVGRTLYAKIIIHLANFSCITFPPLPYCYAATKETQHDNYNIKTLEGRRKNPGKVMYGI